MKSLDGWTKQGVRSREQGAGSKDKNVNTKEGKNEKKK
jgi:hypothetical protein